jgi:hypothetical protein
VSDEADPFVNPDCRQKEGRLRGGVGEGREFPEWEL